MATKLRILLADDHNVVRAGLRALIDAQPDMEVVGEAADGEAAWRQAVDLGPDVIVMDVSMPGSGGARATERIKQDRPEVRVLALTVHEDRGYLQQLLQAGA
jgi:DNA-binding NarL/FixJ family response regulator